jgi:hypothetical protein
MLIHDQLLTGNPWFWLTVSQRFSEVQADAVRTPLQIGQSLVSRYRDQAAVSLLAIIGIAVLVRERRWSIAAGLLGLSLGIAAFLLLLAARGIFVSSRYLASIDLALIMAAAVGVGRLRVPSLRRPSIAPPALALGLSALVGAVIAVALSAPFGPLDGSTRSEIRNERLLAEHADAALATLGHELDAIPASRTFTGDVALEGRPANGHASLLVPVLLRPRMSIDLDVPLTNVGGLTPRHAIPGALLQPGEVIFHDRLGDLPADGYPTFELDQASDFGSLRLEPIVSDAAHGWWVLAAR